LHVSLLTALPSVRSPPAPCQEMGSLPSPGHGHVGTSPLPAPPRPASRLPQQQVGCQRAGRLRRARGVHCLGVDKGSGPCRRSPAPSPPGATVDARGPTAPPVGRRPPVTLVRDAHDSGSSLRQVLVGLSADLRRRRATRPETHQAAAPGETIGPSSAAFTPTSRHLPISRQPRFGTRLTQPKAGRGVTVRRSAPDRHVSGRAGVWHRACQASLATDRSKHRLQSAPCFVAALRV
jgi:hypothetical protein